MFGLGTSTREIMYFWVLVVLLIVFFITMGVFWGVIFAGSILSAIISFRRAHVRIQIRQQNGIYGTQVGDFCSHYCCVCCAVCQEAREAKFVNLPMRDYCSGEIVVPNDNFSVAGIPDEGNDSGLLESDRPTILQSVQNLSKTSFLIIYLSAAMMGISLIILLASDRAQNILVLSLVFIQPCVVLYFFYWKHFSSYASLDFVIKMFAVGFWFTTFQSVVIESIIQIVLVVAFQPLIGSATDDGSGDSQPTQSTGRYLVHFFRRSFFSTAENSTETSVLNPPPLAFYVLYQILNAFVLAGGTEETMKNFAVRCCQFPGNLKHPYTILVYMMSAALGFATCENIEYVFGVSNAKGGRISALEEELVVLCVRVLMPVHLICSVLQSASLSTVGF
jgi:Cys-rich protein (TIGR01571 family)